MTHRIATIRIFFQCVLVLIGSCLALPLRADDGMKTAQANTMVEWTFKSQKTYADPFHDVELDAVFNEPGGRQLRVPAFWAGDQSWRVRYASGTVGVHSFRTLCSDSANASLHGVEGRVTVVAYEGDNPLYRHGPLRVASDGRHLEHVDGTPFLWLGDTWWMGLCERLHWPDEFKALAADRRAKGFNVVQIVGGLYPDMPAFDPRGRNEAGFPWEADYERINPKYFDAADKRIAWLVEQGFVPCIVGAWGYHLPWLGVDRMKQHWRYLVARYGAWPVVWCVAGEATMPYYLSKNKEQDRQFQLEGWTDVAAALRRVDPFRRLVTIHPSGGSSSRKNVADVSVIDIDMLQTGHGDRASIAPTIRLVRESRQAVPPRPTVNGEVCYEGILNTCFADVQRFMVWSCLLSSTAGHTYGANGIWQLNRRDAPYGASPHGGNWGNTPWDEAMRLPGSRQVGLAKQLLERYPWNRFEPHPEWASVVRRAREPAWGDWIWFPEGNPAVDAPAERRYFRRTVQIPEAQAVQDATLWIAADDQCTAFLNGKRVGSQTGWQPPREFAAIKALLKPGANVLAIEARNNAAPVPQNPAGLMASMAITLADGTRVDVRTDAAWTCSRLELPGWEGVNFDAGKWWPAQVVARHGAGPWGNLQVDRGEFLVPYAAGIPREVRIIYLPTDDPVTVRGLEMGTSYRASFFDPITGETSALGMVQPDAAGTWRVPAQPARDQDWVLVLEAAK